MAKKATRVIPPPTYKAGVGRDERCLVHGCAMLGQTIGDEQAARKLIVFQHDSKLGNAPSHKLFEMVTVKGLNNPRDFSEH